MSDPLFYLILVAMAAVVIVLAIGIGGFAKGGAFNAKYANKMMRLRILFQFIAVLLILLLTSLAHGAREVVIETTGIIPGEKDEIVKVARDQIADAGMQFMPGPPDTYYEMSKRRVKGHQEPLDEMKKHGILIDGEGVVGSELRRPVKEGMRPSPYR